MDNIINSVQGLGNSFAINNVKSSDNNSNEEKANNANSFAAPSNAVDNSTENKNPSTVVTLNSQRSNADADLNLYAKESPLLNP